MSARSPTRRYQSFMSDSARWDRFAFRPGDVVITTPSKAGTTWMQTLCALAVFRTPELPASIDELSPWMDMLTRPVGEVHALLERQQHRRFIKTHVPLDGLPLRDDVRYVVVGRDPRDIAVSWHHHLGLIDGPRMVELRRATLEAEGRADQPDPGEDADDDERQLSDPADTFAWFVATTDEPGPAPTLANVLYQLYLAWELRDAGNVALFHYADLLQDLPSELARLAAFIGEELTDEQCRTLAAAAGIAEMRRDVQHRAPGAGSGYWQDPVKFFRAGTAGEWQLIARAEDIARYDRVVREFGDREFIEWVHHGRLGNTVIADDDVS
jgi:aryl sulfotransferase